jgi:hypothetical protein
MFHGDALEAHSSAQMLVPFRSARTIAEANGKPHDYPSPGIDLPRLVWVTSTGAPPET